jgi:hypothetical protein
MNKTLETDIATCDGIIVSGYFPEKEILRYFISPKVFFGYTDTSYILDSDDPYQEDNNILYFLHNCICNTQYYFTEFYMIYNDSGVILKCQDFKHFVELHEEYNNQIIQQITDNNTDSVNSLNFNDV